MYENLVSNPREVVEAMAAHLGIPFSENLLVPTLRGKAWPGLSSFQETREIEKHILDRPLQVLESREIEMVRKHLADLLETYGYEAERQVSKGSGL